VFCADFNRDAEVRRYAAFLEDLTRLVTEKYDGSLKAEHGTGRNMAPFVEREWGTEAYEIMREIKQIFDPRHLLNPGVILTDDPRLHVSNLKTIPSSHPIIEKCTECGFCERTCPSQNLSLSPRQRITAWREISEWTAKVGELKKEDRNRLKRMRHDFDYLGDQTCAVDGLCATLCPVGIDTGAFIKELRRSRHSPFAQALGNAAAAHLDLLLAVSRTLLGTANAAHSVLGASSMNRLTDVLRKVSRNALPMWNPWVPRPSSHSFPVENLAGKEKVVYFPCCVSRLFGASMASPYPDSQNARIERLVEKAGYSVIYPEGLDNLCCGMAFSSKGYSSQATRKMNELVDVLSVSSQHGDYPFLIDASPCAQRLKEYQVANPNLRIYDIADFLMDFVAPRVHMKKRPGRVAVHVPCSLRRSAQEKSLISLAEMCSEKVCIPESVACCGFAGDRGFSNPELTASALVRLPTALPSDCQTGYSSSRTCEIGVSLHSGISYQSIAYLVDEAVQTVDGS
jgi:D-lactate dehydrogenase